MAWRVVTAIWRFVVTVEVFLIAAGMAAWHNPA